MLSMLKAIGALSCGFVLCVSLPNTTQAINNLAQELEQQEADEQADKLSGAVKQEKETPTGAITVRGEVLRIKRNNYLIRKFTGDVEHLHLDDNTQKTETIRQGDRIVAKVDDQRHVLLIGPIQ